jgi:23S rRNA pseudouridine1911/1915/1917 synthase
MNLTRAAEKKDRPAARDRGGYYRTEIIALKEFSGLPSAGGQGKAAGLRVFRLRIRRGFRHQIRCHLAWIGEPILNDTLYGLEKRYTGESCPIALRAAAFCFFDPATGKQKDYRLPLIGSG